MLVRAHDVGRDPRRARRDRWRSLVEHAPLVVELAQRLAEPGVERDDLAQEGWLALLEAGERLEAMRAGARSRYARGYLWLRMTGLRTAERRRRTLAMLAMADRPATPDAESRSLAAAQERERWQLVERALATLSVGERCLVEALHLTVEPASRSSLQVRLQLSERRLREVEAAAIARLLSASNHSASGGDILIGGRRFPVRGKQRSGGSSCSK